MMSIDEKAERIWNELVREKANIWYVSDKFGFKIMIKAPSIIVRSIIQGCKVVFKFGKDDRHSKSVFHTGVSIYDDAIHYSNISGTHRFEDEHLSLKRIIKNELIPIQLYNELCVCVATAFVSFDVVSRRDVLKLMGDVDGLYIGKFDSQISKSLDCFDHTFDKSRPYTDVYEIETISIEGKFEGWKIMDNRFVGVNDQSKVIIDDKDEGGLFEKQVWAPLESLFDYDIHLRPQVSHKKGKRELIDILAFSEYGIFLIESKALSIVDTAGERNMNKKVAAVQKQIEKGIGQLIGAAKKVAENETIYSSKGEVIEFNRRLLPHCIVLVSELFPFGEWTPLVMKMFQAMIDQPMQLHVMDLKEFMQYIGHAKKSKYMFDYLLMERTKSLVEHQNIHIQLHGKDDKN